MLKLDLNGKIIYCNHAFARLCERPVKALMNQSFYDLDLFLNGFTQSMLKDAMTLTLWNEEIHGKHRNGKPFWMEVFLRKSYNQSMHHNGFTLICKDITAEKTQKMQFSHDPTTKVLSHHVFKLFITQSTHEFKRYKDDYCLMNIQLDNLTEINHRYGFQSGDEVLHEMSEIINDTFRKTDVIARWNGNSFAVLLTRTDLETSLLVERKLEKNIEKYCFSVDQSLNIRIGSAALLEGMSDEDWIQEMLAKTYQTKTFSSPEPTSQII